MNINTKYEIGDVATLNGTHHKEIVGIKIYYDTGEPYGSIEESRLEGKVISKCKHIIQGTESDLWLDWYENRVIRYSLDRDCPFFCPSCGEKLTEETK